MLARSLPRMLVSDQEGWTDLFRSPPSVPRILLTRVLPCAALPPLLCMYSVHTYPGAVLPAIAPASQPLAMVLLGLAAIGLQLAVVALMAGQIRLLANAPAQAFDAGIGEREALAFAAIVPLPLWISSVALLVPSRGVLVLCIAIGWLGSAALIEHGIVRLFRPTSTAHARALKRALLARGVFGWVMIVAALVLPLYALAALR